MKKILIIIILSVFCASLCEAQIKADVKRQEETIKAETAKKAAAAAAAKKAADEAAAKKAADEAAAKKAADEVAAKKAAAANEHGIVINGVRWATCNVDDPGTFAATPESAGKMYQYGRNPCPAGWRVPTKAELKSLIKAKSVWTTQNGVNGRLFGSGGNTVFLPAVHNAGAYGNYWGSSDAFFTGGSVSYLDFSERGVSTGNRVASALHCVRCVAK